MRSIFSDFFIGTLFVWPADSDLQAELECEPIVGFNKSPIDKRVDDQRADIVLDGQQRLTAMRNAFFWHHDRTSSRSRPNWFSVDIERFMDAGEDDPSRDSAFEINKATRSDVEWFNTLTEDDSATYEYNKETQEHRFPLWLLGAAGTRRAMAWLDSYIRYWSEEANTYKSKAEEQEKKHAKHLRDFNRRSDNQNNIDQGSYDPKRKELEQKLEDAKAKLEECEAEQNSLYDEVSALRKELKNSNHTGRDVETGRRKDKLHSRYLRKKEEMISLQGDVEIADQELASHIESLASDKDDAENQHDTYDEELLNKVTRAGEKQYANEQKAKKARQYVSFGMSFADKINSLITGYRVPVLSIGGKASKMEVSDMFSQLNRRGVKLRHFDLLNAQTSLQGIPLRKMTDEFIKRLNDRGLQCGSSSRDVLARIVLINAHPKFEYKLSSDLYALLAPSQSDDSLIRDIADFERRWTEAQEAYETGLITLRKESWYGHPVTSKARLGDFIPFQAVLPVYCSLLAYASGDDRQENRVRQWYWASVLTQRYASDNEDNPDLGKIDLRQAYRWIDGEAEAKTPEAILKFEEDFGTYLVSREMGISAQLAKGIRGLFLVLQPKDWISGEQSATEDVTERGLVSQQWCQDQGLPSEFAESIFNEVFLSDNVAELVAGRSPKQYIERIFADRSIAQMHSILYSHCISPTALSLLMQDTFTTEDFVAFLNERKAEFLRRLARELFQDLDLDTDSL